MKFLHFCFPNVHRRVLSSESEVLMGRHHSANSANSEGEYNKKLIFWITQAFYASIRSTLIGTKLPLWQVYRQTKCCNYNVVAALTRCKLSRLIWLTLMPLTFASLTYASDLRFSHAFLTYRPDLWLTSCKLELLKSVKHRWTRSSPAHNCQCCKTKWEIMGHK